MGLSGQTVASGLYFVEVSGWDIDEVFFVEKSAIEWDEDDEKRVKLRRPLRKGSLIFIRLTQTSAGPRAYPIAYEVDPLRACEEDLCEYRLIQVQRRARRSPFGLG
jgi:hypothetical protein